MSIKFLGYHIPVITSQALTAYALALQAIQEITVYLRAGASLPEAGLKTAVIADALQAANEAGLINTPLPPVLLFIKHFTIYVDGPEGIRPATDLTREELLDYLMSAGQQIEQLHRLVDHQRKFMMGFFQS